MPIPMMPSSSRSEITEHLFYIQKVLKQHQSLDESREVLIPLDFTKCIDRLSDMISEYQQPFRLAVVGEFNAGKSSVINILLGRKVVKEGFIPTTGSITEIYYSEEEVGKVFDNNNAEVFSGSIENVSKYSDQRTSEGKRISGKGSKVSLGIQADLLKNMIILDTPGLGANALDDKVTFDSLYKADAAILVLHGQRPGGENSISLVERLRRANRKLIVLVNHMDKVENPSDALSQAKEYFGKVSVGEPIGLSCSNILKTLKQLEKAVEDGDSNKIQQCNNILIHENYFELRSRLQEDYFSNLSEQDRARNTLSTVKGDLFDLKLETMKEEQSAQEKAMALQDELSDARRKVAEVLRPKIPYLEGKIDDIVDKNVSDFIGDLSEAVDVYIDKVADGGISLGLSSIWAKVSSRKEKKIQRKLRKEFEELFPEEQVDIMVDDIARAAKRLMELEWQQILTTSKPEERQKTIDTSSLMRDITSHLAELTALIATEVAGWIALLFIPGGIVIDIIWILLSLGFSKKVAGKEIARITRVKREAKVRLRGQRKILKNRLAKFYWDENERVAKLLIAEVEKLNDKLSSSQKEVKEMADRWNKALADIQRLIEATEGVLYGERQ